MDKINFNTSALEPMFDWLLKRKRTGKGDENRLREILDLPDYRVEFERYSSPSLPVCGISFEEAVDFFMNFDRKDFANQRLQYKREAFLSFYNELEERKANIDAIASMTQEDYNTIESLLKNGLPDELLEELPEFTIILIVSIGNSMGWPYEHYVDYDVANLQAFKSRNDFLHITAHELHHILAGPLLAPEGIRGEDFFLQNFAYEGLAVHYMNNLGTRGKKAKYNDAVYVMDQEDMAFYETHFDEIFEMIRRDYRSCIGKSLDEVSRIVSEHYEQFTFMGKNMSFMPWTDDFSRGLYLAGIEVYEDTPVPAGWVKWIMPARKYLVTEVDLESYEEIIQNVINHLIPELGMKLAGAVCDFTEPATGQNKLFFPVALVNQISAKEV